MTVRIGHLARALGVAGAALFISVIYAGLAATSSVVSAADYTGGSETGRYDRDPHDRAFDHGHTFTEHDDDLYSAAPSPKKYDKRQTYTSPSYKNSDAYPPAYGSLKDGPVDTYRAPRKRYGHARDYAPNERYNHYDKRQSWGDHHNCLPRRHIRRQLRRAGWRGFWRDFRRGHRNEGVSYARARQRGTGDRYELAIDRCTGEVLSAEYVSGPNRRWHRRGIPFDDYRGDIVLRW